MVQAVIAGTGSILGQSVLDLLCAKWHWDSFFLLVIRLSAASTILPVLHAHLSKTHAVESHQMTALSDKILLCIAVTILLRYTLSCLISHSVWLQTLFLVPACLVIMLGVTSNIPEQYHKLRSDSFIH